MCRRASVKKLTLCLSYPGGISEVRTVDGLDVEAVFTTVRGVEEILAPFYRRTERYVNAEELLDVFGGRVREIIGDTETVRITPQLITDLWNCKNDKGVLPPLMIKKTDGSIRFLKMHPWVFVFGGYPDPRPKIDKVILHTLDDEGYSVNSIFAGEDVEGVFWSVRAVSGMLSTLYNSYRLREAGENLLQVFGGSAAELSGDTDEVFPSPELINRSWNLENGDGPLPISIIKRAGIRQTRIASMH